MAWKLLARSAWIAFCAIAVSFGLLVGCGSSQPDSSAPAGAVAQDQSATSPPSAGALSVGECISYGDYAAGNLTAPAVDCASSDAVFELVYEGGSEAACPDGNRGEASSYGVISNSSRMQCFIPNVVEGSCYFIDVEAKMFVPEDCTSPDAVTKISLIAEGTTDVAVCGPDRGVAFPEPARVYCVVAP